jgi:hypothetical protein
MQTKLAFLFVLHVLAIGLCLGRTGARLHLRNFIFVFAYFFGTYAAWGMAMNSMPSLYVPETLGK